MKYIRAMVLPIALLVCAAITGCGNHTTARGYFYVRSLKSGYVVSIDAQGLDPVEGTLTVDVTQPGTLNEARVVCDKFNAGFSTKP